MSIARILFSVAIFCLINSPANAQVATGTYPDGSFDQAGIETINVGNLNDLILIPVVNKPGRAGTNFSYTLALNSSIWTPTLVAGVMTWVPDVNWGWSGETQVATGYLSFLTLRGNSCRVGQYTLYNTKLSGFACHDRFGQVIGFAGAGSNEGPCSGTYSNFPAAGGYGYTLTNAGTVITPSRQTIQPPENVETGAGAYTDTNGNQITTSGSTFVDTLGKSVLTISGSPSSSQYLTYVDSNGNNQQVTITYSTYTERTAFGCSSVSEFGSQSEPLVSKISFPDGTYYQFNYEATPGIPGDVTGRVDSINCQPEG